jgi:hypothetical protein
MAALTAIVWLLAGVLRHLFQSVRSERRVHRGCGFYWPPPRV